MKKEHIFSIIVLVLVWQISASIIHNDVVIPLPLDVIQYLFKLILDFKTYQIIGTTLLRVFEGFTLSLLLALICAVLSSYYTKFRHFFEPIYILSKTIPNVSYIIIVLMLLGSEKSVWFICLLIVFPICYNNILFALDNEPSDLKDVAKLLVTSKLKNLYLHTIPSLKKTLLSTTKLALSLGIKVSIMGEILGQVKQGIGKALYLCRINLDTTGIFAWTIIIIIICVLIDLIFNYFINKEQREG